jgi:large subunit ribosomal protein L21
VKTGDVIDVDRLSAEVGSWTEFKDVLAVSRDGELIIGQPIVPDASVLAQVQTHAKDRKITVFKYKRKVRYRRKKGHRQQYTRLTISGIFLGNEEIDIRPEVVPEELAVEPTEQPTDETAVEITDQAPEVGVEVEEEVEAAVEEVTETQEPVIEAVAEPDVSQAEEPTKPAVRKRQARPKATRKTPTGTDSSTTAPKSPRRSRKVEAKDDGS